jgi:hypothetical protein
VKAAGWALLAFRGSGHCLIQINRNQLHRLMLSGKLIKAAAMKEFQLYILTSQGAVKKRYALHCESEAYAMELASDLTETDPVELWDPPFGIARIDPKFQTETLPAF